MNIEKKQIEINPRVIQHLGKDLITSSDVAVVELVKNSIDAGAPKIALRLFDSLFRVKHSSNYLSCIQESAFLMIPSSLHDYPVCLVEDLGKGMNEHQLIAGFLTVGTGIKSDEDPTALGEKGIGRLATQRLGKALLVETVSKDSPDTILYTFIDWNGVFAGNTQVNFLKESINKTRSYTRLWIIGIDLADFLDVADQVQFAFDINYSCNKELQSALNFLISPFKNTAAPELSLEYNDTNVPIDFVGEMLELSESTHYFRYTDTGLEYGLEITPWYIERIHLAAVKDEAFKRLRKPHSFYAELLQHNSDRIATVLKKSFAPDIVFDSLVRFYSKAIPCKNNDVIDAYQAIWCEKATESISLLSTLAPISSKIYSFKQNSKIAKDIIIDSIKDQRKSLGCWTVENEKTYNINNLKAFLANYNGIKLYRGSYRIGFLGNKENDWIKLQQFRTKGQQWYRFDLGNTVGYVSLNDPEQKRIKEISSRLDIQENEFSIAFKTLIDIVFNTLFYELNRSANALIKTILEEEGLLTEPLSKRVKKNDTAVKKILEQNKKMLDLIHRIGLELSAEITQHGENIVIPKQRYTAAASMLSDIDRSAAENIQLSQQTAQLLAEANEQLKVIEVESYNNFKLMANGLITETITHELHSVSSSGTDESIPEHFDALKLHHREQKSIPVYNAHVKPIKSGYQALSGKINRVSDLYSFLETTFIRKGTYDDFEEQNIAVLVKDVFDNLLSFNQIKNLDVNCKTEELSWYAPKGVLLHVFYNLFANSMYWIDKRREYAKHDPKYALAGNDAIIVEPCGDNELIVYDSGPGVATDMEDILFEPLQSGKPHAEGRGMGLYIVRQIMQSFGGDIHLLNERNQYGNRYKFVLTLVEEK